MPLDHPWWRFLLCRLLTSHQHLLMVLAALPEPSPPGYFARFGHAHAHWARTPSGFRLHHQDWQLFHLDLSAHGGIGAVAGVEPAQLSVLMVLRFVEHPARHTIRAPGVQAIY